MLESQLDNELKELRDALLPGSSLSNYKIEEVLGYGGYSLVYRARHVELEYPVAVKEYFPTELAVRNGSTVDPRSRDTLPYYEDGLNRFKKKPLQIIGFRNDPGIVTGLAFFRGNGTAYFVMEHIDGMSLSELLRERESVNRPLNESELLSLIKPVAETLARLHRRDILHRDIKPSNILVRRSDGRPVLIDFGAAKQGAAIHTKSLAPFTEGYAALEQVSEGQLGPWTDVYALGAVMWRIVAGSNPPWHPPNPKKVETRAFAILSGENDPLPPAVDLGRSLFSDELLRLIDSCLPVRYNQRTRDCSALLTRLELLQSNKDISVRNDRVVYSQETSIEENDQIIDRFDEDEYSEPQGTYTITGELVPNSSILGSGTEGKRSQGVIWGALIACILFSLLVLINSC